MYWLKITIFGIILVGHQTFISNALEKVKCYRCGPKDDEKLHWREFSVNNTLKFYPPKCKADEIEKGYTEEASILCKKGCGVVKLTRLDEKGMYYVTISMST